MTTAKIRLNFVPFDKQADALLDKRPIVALVSGARGGKTQTGSFRTLVDAIRQPGYHPLDIERGYPYTIAVGAPTYPMLYRIILPTILSMAPPSLVIGRYHETKKRLRLRGRRGITEIYFISAKNIESWYGMSLYRIWMDEFALIKEELYDETQTRLSDRKGKLFMTGTPQGPNWAFKRIYQPWVEKSDSTIGFHTWRTVDNPWIDSAYIEAKRATMPKRYFVRTFEATWDTFEGQVYEEFAREIHVRRRADYRFWLPSGKYVGRGDHIVRLLNVFAGVDWGYGSGHAGVIVVVGQDSTGRWWILDEEVAEHLLKTAEPLADSWVNRAKVLRHRWEIKKFFCDTEDPEAIAQFRRAGLKAVGAIKDVMSGIETVARYLHPDDETVEPRLIVLDTCSETIDEFCYYHWKEGAAREQPDKVNDNCMDAVRYAIYSQEAKGRFKREPDYSPAPT